MFFSFAKNTEVSYCTFENNTNSLFLAMARNTNVHHCTITNSSFTGLLCFTSSPKITQNNIFENGHNWTENGSAGVVIWNSFCDLRNNWWGSSQGPSINLLLRTKQIHLRNIPDGDEVIILKWYVRGFTSFRPWLSAPVPNAGRQT